MPRIIPAGDSALFVEFEERIDVEVNARTIALADAVQRAEIAGVCDVVPTYRSVAIYFDPLRVDYDALMTRVEHELTRPEARVQIGRASCRERVRLSGVAATHGT